MYLKLFPNMKNRFFIIILCCLPLGAEAQEAKPLDIAPKEVLHLSIEDALELGRKESIDSKENDNTLLKAYWRYRGYLADRRPSITLNSTLPSLNRSLRSYQQENGVYKFVPNNYLSESLTFSIRWTTGTPKGHRFSQFPQAMQSSARAVRAW